jgi:hypothetical protein
MRMAQNKSVPLRSINRISHLSREIQRMKRSNGRIIQRIMKKRKKKDANKRSKLLARMYHSNLKQQEED